MAGAQEQREDVVVVVGAGIGGLHTALRLAQQNIPVVVYEATNRVGGRIETTRLTPGPTGEEGDDFKAEMGPMRFELEMQPIFEGILKRTPDPQHSDGRRIEPDPFASPVSPQLPNPRDLWPDEKLDKKRDEKRDEKRDDVVPLDALGLLKLGLFKLFGIKHELKMKYVDAKGKAADKDAPGAIEDGVEVEAVGDGKAWLARMRDSTLPASPDDNHDEEWTYDHVRRTAHFPGDTSRLLRDEGLWNALDEVLSPGAVSAIHQLGTFFHFLPENLSAVEWGIFWLRYFHPAPGKTDMSTIAQGTDVVVRGLETTLRQLGVRIETNHQAVAVRPRIESPGVEIDIKVGEATKTILAERVVLAVPRKPLQQIAERSEQFPKAVSDVLTDVNAFPMVKVFFVFRTPDWWKGMDSQVQAQHGASRLPTREIHYFPAASTDPDKPVKPSDYTMVLLYTDRPATAFWQHYIADPEHHHQAEVQENDALRRQLAIVLTRLELELAMHELRKRRPSGATAPSSAYRSKIEAEIARFHLSGVTDVPEETATRLSAISPAYYRVQTILADRSAAERAQDIRTYAIRDWSRMPYGSASHCWEPGSKSIEVRKKLAAFALNGQDAATVHVVGEAYSDYQGFIEGALRSAELAIEKIIALRG